MNINIFERFINHILTQHENKFIGTPANVRRREFNIEPAAMRLPKFEKSNIVTINPINR